MENMETNIQLTITEAAMLLGWSESTVRRMMDDGRIAGYRLPGSAHRRIPLSEVNRIKAQVQNQPPPEVQP